MLFRENEMVITSASNDRVKDIKKLIKSASYRYENGVFIVEGIRMFREIPSSDISEVFVAESQVEKFSSYLEIFGDEYTVLADKVYNSISDTGTPQGIMALVKIKKHELKDAYQGEANPCVLILENLQDPGNLGTILRSAEGAGITGIVLSKNSVDLYNPKVVRSTMGSIFRVPVYVSEDLINDINTLKQNGIVVYGAHLNGKNLYEKDFTKACAFLIGNEGKGLSDEVSELADDLLKIPMKGKVESLNAAISATLVSYEVLRQRL